MTREDFKEISKENIETARNIIRFGFCTDKICTSGDCPFDPSNLTSTDSCIDKYARNVPIEEPDDLVVSSCKHFLEIAGVDEECFENPTSDACISLLLSRCDFLENNFRCLEEMAELSQAVSKVLRNKDGARENLVEEIADVTIVLKMLQHLHEISDHELENEINKKMQKNIKRALTKGR